MRLAARRLLLAALALGMMAQGAPAQSAQARAISCSGGASPATEIELFFGRAIRVPDRQGVIPAGVTRGVDTET